MNMKGEKTMTPEERIKVLKKHYYDILNLDFEDSTEQETFVEAYRELVDQAEQEQWVAFADNKPEVESYVLINITVQDVYKMVIAKGDIAIASYEQGFSSHWRRLPEEVKEG